MPTASRIDVGTRVYYRRDPSPSLDPPIRARVTRLHGDRADLLDEEGHYFYDRVPLDHLTPISSGARPGEPVRYGRSRPGPEADEDELRHEDLGRPHSPEATSKIVRYMRKRGITDPTRVAEEIARIKGRRGPAPFDARR